MSDDVQVREQVLSCLEDVKLDLEELKQHSSAIVVGQAVEIINSLVLRLEEYQKLCPSMTELDSGEQLDPASTITVGVGYLHTLLEAKDRLDECRESCARAVAARDVAVCRLDAVTRDRDKLCDEWQRHSSTLESRLDSYRTRTIVKAPEHGHQRCIICRGIWAYDYTAEMHEDWCPNRIHAGAVPVVNPQGTGETGDDRPAAPISECDAHNRAYATKCRREINHQGPHRDAFLQEWGWELGGAVEKLGQ